MKMNDKHQFILIDLTHATLQPDIFFNHNRD